MASIQQRKLGLQVFIKNPVQKPGTAHEKTGWQERREMETPPPHSQPNCYYLRPLKEGLAPTPKALVPEGARLLGAKKCAYSDGHVSSPETSPDV